MTARHVRIVAILGVLALASPAAAAVRVLMVGIDRYAFSHDHDPKADPKFHDLRAAVNDVALMRATLVTAKRLAIAPMPAAGCSSTDSGSIVLVNGCATRANIADAWKRLARASAPGDTLLFFYAGHGATIIDRSGTQESGSSDTIVPHDARGPQQNPEILDVELKQWIDATTAEPAAVNVVTIFDSCSSGTATRAIGDSGRALPPAPPRRLPVFAPVPQGSRPGARVHLSAAADGQIAVERVQGRVPARNGLFTVALTRAIVAAPDATYADLIARVRAALVKEEQVAGAEGAITGRFLGPRPPPGRAFLGRAAGGKVLLDFGTLSQVTRGSTFAIHASSSAAMVPGARPLATGRVVATASHAATIAPDPGTPFTASGSVFVAEITHDYGDDRIRLRIDGTPAQRAVVDAARARLPVVIDPVNPAFVARWTGDTVRLLDTASPPEEIYRGIDRPPGSVTRDLAGALRRVANFRALVALQAAAGPPLATLRFRIGVCSDARSSAPMLSDGVPTFAATDKVLVKAGNIADRRLFSYLFALNHDYRVVSLNPPGADKPIESAKGLPAVAATGLERCETLAGSDGGPADIVAEAAPGRSTVLAILSEDRLDADALAQDGSEGGERSFGGCPPGALAYLLCKASGGSRSVGAKLWTVATATSVVR